MRTSLILYCFLSIVPQEGSGVLLYRYNSLAITWNDARQECVNKGGNLVNGSFEQRLQNCTSIPTQSNFWVGSYDTFSTWIRIVGCFQDNLMNITEEFNLNDAITCAEKCSTNSFGMNEDTCYCLQSNFVSDHTSVSDTLCNTTCRGNEQDSCGGDGYITVYKKESEVEERLDDTDRNEIMCGCIECTNEGWKYFGYSCNRSLLSYCNNKQLIDDNQNWNNAKETCWASENSFLLGNGISTLECNQNTTRAPHWIGLYRRKVKRTVSGAESIVVTDCHSGYLSAGILRLNRNDNCSLEYPFICELDTDDILPTDCLLEPLVTTTSMETTEPTSDVTTTNSLTTTDEMTTPDGMTTSTSASTTDVPLTTTTKNTIGQSASNTKDDANKLSAGTVVAIIVAVAIPTALVIGTIMCHLICGQKPPVPKREDDNVQLRNKEDFYIRPPSYTEDMAEIRYSLFDEDKDILVPEEPEMTSKRPIIPEVTKIQTEDGRFSTFVTVTKVNGDAEHGHVNVEDQLTKL